ncbi:hypothetical protein [Bacillus gobiensis]|uniref:hypothetical protein n=1 Tax=Bacillus gobiensis TaxID=1441095 RepID=UPI003D211C1F
MATFFNKRKQIIAIHICILLTAILTACSGVKNQIKWTEYPDSERELINLAGEQYFSATITGLTNEINSIRMYVEEYQDGNLTQKYEGPELDLFKKKKPKGLRTLFILEENETNDFETIKKTIKMGLIDNEGSAMTKSVNLDTFESDTLSSGMSSSAEFPSSIPLGEPVLIGCNINSYTDGSDFTGAITDDNKNNLIKNDHVILFYVKAD